MFDQDRSKYISIESVDVIKSSLHMVSNDKNREPLTCVSFSYGGDKDTVRIEAANSYLAFVADAKGCFYGFEEGDRILIKAEHLKLALKTLPKGAEFLLRVDTTLQQASFTAGTYELLFPLFQGQFPDISKVKPQGKHQTSFFGVAPSTLTKATKAVSELNATMKFCLNEPNKAFLIEAAGAKSCKAYVICMPVRLS